MAFSPIFFVENDIFFYAWPAFSVVFSTFCFITYLIHIRSLNAVPHEDREEVLFESENGLLIVHEIPKPIPLTLKQSARKGLWWTGYIYFVLALAILLGSLF